MKVLQISGFDTLGIQVNGYLLHRRLLERGHGSNMLVHGKFSTDENVLALTHPFFSLLNRIAVKVQDKLSLWSLLPTEGLSTLGRKEFWNADIVHMQLVHNAQFFSLFIVALISRLKPKGRVFLSIHDMFMVTGHCIYSLGCERWKTGCGSCPDLEIPFPIKKDTTRISWLLKRLIFRMARVQLVVGSPWQQRMIEASPILRHLPVHYIPYGIDTRQYRIKDKGAARKRFGIPDEAHVISFRYVPFSRNFKGIDQLVDAVNLYEPVKETYLLTFEAIGGVERFSDKYKVIQIAWTNDDQDQIADALNAADVFLMPSIAEAFGLMAAESMACGAPVIVFEGTALPETVNAPECGVAVPMKDHVALAGAIARVLGDDDYRKRLSEGGARYVNAKHNFEDYVDHHLSLYGQMLQKNKLKPSDAATISDGSKGTGA